MFLDEDHEKRAMNVRKAAMDVFYELIFGCPNQDIEVKNGRSGVSFRFQTPEDMYEIECSPYWESIKFNGENVTREEVVKRLQEVIEL